MASSLESLLTELEALANPTTPHYYRPRRMNNITRDTGEFLAVLVRATFARRILEIGTSNGYSTLWLASAARAIGGMVTTVELSDYKLSLARPNFARSGLESSINSLQDDAGRLLERTPTPPLTSSSSTPIAPSTPSGGPTSIASSAPAASSSSTTPPPTPPKSPPSSPSSPPTPTSPSPSSPSAKASSSPSGRSPESARAPSSPGSVERARAMPRACRPACQIKSNRLCSTRSHRPRSTIEREEERMMDQAFPP